MATVSKTFTENQSSSGRATWTISVAGANQTVTGNFTLTAPTVKAKFVYSGKTKGLVYIPCEFYVGSTWLGAHIYQTKNADYGTLVSMASGTVYTIPRSSSDVSVTLSQLFNSNNRTSKTVNITAYATPNLESSSPGNSYVSGSSTNFGTVSTITLNAPPTFSSTNVSFDTPYVYAGYTTASVTISSLSAKYGGTISSAVLTIGSQTASRSNNGTLSIALNKAGTFTPTVKVTDSRGQVTTKSLNSITVNPYVAPSVSFTAERTDSTGVANDEGESAVVTARFNWTSAVATLTQPTVTATDPSGTAVITNVTWYKDRALTTAVSDWSAITSSDMPLYCLIDNANHDAFDTQFSYQISIRPNDSESSGTAITQILGAAFYTVDFLAGGHGIAFGLPATREDVAEFGMDIAITRTDVDEAWLTTTRVDTGVTAAFGIGSGGANHGVWSNPLNKWMLYSNGTHIYMPELTITGHSSPIGTIKDAWLSSAKSVASGTASSLCSISLEAGTWVVNCGVRFPTNATGYRRANISETSGSSDVQIQVPPTSGEWTQLVFTKIIKVSSTTTYYLNAQHNAGTALTMPASGEGYGSYIRAIRIL